MIVSRSLALRLKVMMNAPQQWRELIEILESAGSGAEIMRVPFTFASGAVALVPLALGAIVSPCYVRITTPWNLPGASLRVGTPSDPGALLDTSDVDLYTLGRYDAMLDLKATIAENLQLVVSGPSTAGAGYVLFTMEG